MSDIEASYFATSDYNNFTNKILVTKTKEKRLIYKYEISGFIDYSDLDKKKSTRVTKG